MATPPLSPPTTYNTYFCHFRKFCHVGASMDDWDLVNLLYLKSSHDSEIVWLVSSYVLYIWETVHVKRLEVKRDKFFGYLTFKYKMHQTSSPDQPLNLHHIYN